MRSVNKLIVSGSEVEVGKMMNMFIRTPEETMVDAVGIVDCIYVLDDGSAIIDWKRNKNDMNYQITRVNKREVWILPSDTLERAIYLLQAIPHMDIIGRYGEDMLDEAIAELKKIQQS